MSIFGEKTVVGPEKSFSCQDLLDHVELLIKLAKDMEKKTSPHNYSWLRSKSIEENNNMAINNEVAQMKPLLNKMTSESCAAIAVKLDNYTDNTLDITTDKILDALKSFVQEEFDFRFLEKSVKEMKIKKNKSFRTNKVKPELTGREATVSFVLDVKYI